jgi:hypothetical protein
MILTKATKLIMPAALVALSMFWSMLSVCPALSQTETISKDEALQKIKEAKILDPRCAVRLGWTGKAEVMVVTARNPKAIDDDCKIDAVMITKTLMDAYPNQFVRVKVIFSKGDGDCSAATVTAGDIKSFKVRALDKKSLLDSIELVKVSSLDVVDSSSAVNPTTVIAGPFQPWRLTTLEHITGLSREGVNVKVFMDDFNAIETMVRTSPPREVRNALAILTAHLNDQDELTREAKTSAHPVTANGRQERSWLQVRARLQELAKEGKDISSYQEQLREIRELRSSGRNLEANHLFRQLARTLSD